MEALLSGTFADQAAERFQSNDSESELTQNQNVWPVESCARDKYVLSADIRILSPFTAFLSTDKAGLDLDC